ncbi:hypothetical protein VTK56DRAFT_4947 [Thermocarpiscus australiensis]
MMATESPKERSDEAALTSAPEPTIKIDTDSQNVDVTRPHVNGDAAAADEPEKKHISDIVDDLVNSTEVSISGGSDNEATKSDASKSKDDAKGHGRTSSAVKKPASFKPIKVNKTFLNPKGSAPSAQSKTSEKAPANTSSTAAPSGTSTAPRPRLVAKTGSGLITKTSSGANGGKPASAPDPNVVWNKNRPAPAPEPKKYTDEELKKYGIHMATRLHPDDSKGQSNWADIDDDDEDWAPDTITWKDGTKIAIAHSDDHRAPPSEQVTGQAAKDDGATDKAKAPAPGTSPSVKPSVLPSGKGLVLKGAPEKPTLVAKPPAPPAPVKSPWAPLPKIDKVSPVAVDVPSQAGLKLPPKDASIQKTNTPPPPKEIAADDFSRAPWRDGAAGANRELFNSQSGRYEPVFDRRGPMRPDAQHSRQPALLQRPPPQEQQGLVEPAGAFQAGRNAEPPGPYGRRRTSSNASGGSGSWQRPRGLEHPLPPPELVNARRASVAGKSDGPASPRSFSPSGIQGGPRHGQAWQPRVSPGSVHAAPYHQAGQVPDGRAMPPPVQQPPVQPSVVPVTEEDYELQKRLMRERRELAMRRRQEEEAREEAARRERIRLKLEALGPAPESKSAKMAAAAKEQAATPTQIQSRENPASQKPATTEGSQTSEKAVPAAAAPEPAKQPSQLPNGVQAQGLPPPDGGEPRPQPHGSTHAHPWPPATQPADRHPATSWGPQPSAKNVWGAPNNNRSLGNGTFATDIGAPQLPQLPSKPGPGPIAPPNGGRTAVTSQAATSAPAARQPPIGPPRQISRNEQLPGVGGSTAERERKENSWAAAVRLNDEKFAEMLNAQYEERDRRLQAEGRSLTEIQPTIKDTWRPTKLDENGRRAEAAPKQTIQIGPENPWAATAESKSATSQQAPSVSSAAPSEYSHLTTTSARDMTSASILSAKAAASQQSRGSRFFPSPREARQEAGTGVVRPKSPSPPPPDMAGHPAFDGDVTHPHVSLPRPHPVVRLPPSVAKESQVGAAETNKAPPAPPRSPGPSFAWAAQAAYKGPDNTSRAPVHKDNVWQAKIDNLLGGRRMHSPPKSTGSDSGMRGASHQPEPSSPQPSGISYETDVMPTTKPMAEECFEEQEMGSVPPVRVPTVTPEMAWQPSPAPKVLPKKLYPAVTSAESISFPPDMSGAGTVWLVRLPGHESKQVVIPFGRTRSNPRRGGPRGGRHPTGPQHRQGKGREPPYAAEQGPSNSGPNPSQGRGHRGGYRGRDNWSRNAPAQVQT